MDARTLSIRCADQGDAAVIARHRVEMFRDMGRIPNEVLAQELLEESQIAIAAALGDGSYLGWLAINGDGPVVAGAGVHLKPHLPRIAPDGSRVALSLVPLVVNVYTEPAWRKRGIARVIMSTLMQWARETGYDQVVLHASDAGRPLYTSLGFTPTNEMRWGRSRLGA